MTKGERYIKDILSGKVNHGEWIKLLCESHVKDLSGSDLWYFDKVEAERYVKFIEKLSLTKGEWAGKNFDLEDWQAFIIELTFGWKSKETDKRRYTEVTINVAKKNGKTEFAAAIAIAVSLLDREHGGQIYMAATARDQASLCFHTAKDMLKFKPQIFDKYFKPMANAIFVPSLSASIKAISSEASTAEGKGASCVIFDEEHEQKDNQLRDNLRSGMAARSQPIFISISTAGVDKSKPYFKHLEKCKNILIGHSINDRHLIVIYAAPEKMDWENPETWKIANPNFAVSVKPDFLATQHTEAKNDPSKQPVFITKHLNIWADSTSTWIDSKVWKALGHNLTLEDFEGEECYLGLDLGETGDFSALAIIFNRDGKQHVFMKFWIPEIMAGKRTKSDALKFNDWARLGFIKLTDGNSTDFTLIEEDIVKLSSRFQITSLAYDSAYASMLITRLTNEWGIVCKPFSQGIKSVTAPTKQMHEWILKGELLHDNNPVMNWMMGNVQVYIDDANNNLKVHKGKSKNKVDGVTALVNAVGDYLIDYSNNYGDGNLIFV
jgi:phage terminase large subunit-like protein